MAFPGQYLECLMFWGKSPDSFNRFLPALNTPHGLGWPLTFIPPSWTWTLWKSQLLPPFRGIPPFPVACKICSYFQDNWVFIKRWILACLIAHTCELEVPRLCLLHFAPVSQGSPLPTGGILQWLAGLVTTPVSRPWVHLFCFSLERELCFWVWFESFELVALSVSRKVGVPGKGPAGFAPVSTWPATVCSFLP